jgi:hypothetical protein
MQTPTKPSADEVWVAENRELFDRVFELYLENGEWPKLPELRRHFAQRGQILDVQAIADAKPRVAFELRLVHQESISLQIRHLQYMHRWGQFIQACLTATRRAVETYLAIDAEAAVVRSDDPQISLMLSNDLNTLLRVGPFLSSEHPSPFSGGGYGPENWQFSVNESVILDFQHVYAAAQFVEAQERIRDRWAREAAKQGFVSVSEKTRSSVFVIMPFREQWSASTYEMIRRAIDSIGLPYEIDVKRADDIRAPGRITDQIMQEINSADVVVADITKQNPNVMWELGYAYALGKPTIILNQNIERSPFDLADHRQIVYSHPSDAIATIIREHLLTALGTQ